MHITTSHSHPKSPKTKYYLILEVKSYVFCFREILLIFRMKLRRSKEDGKIRVIYNTFSFSRKLCLVISMETECWMKKQVEF